MTRSAATASSFPTAVRAAAAATLACAAVGLAPWTSSASADPVPFTDHYAQGVIGLCDANGNQVTSGRVTDKPFVALSVSSVSAPVGYGAKGNGKVALYAFQPRQEVDPGEWSGQLMTGGSLFSNDTYPMAAGTSLDASMADFVEAFPPRWSGLVELRMYFGAPDKVTFKRSYPAAVLKVSGDRWTVVQGGNVPCNEGKAVSTERILLPSTAFASPSAHTATKGTDRTPPSARPSTAAASPTGAGASASVGSSAAGRAPASSSASSASSSRGTSTGMWLVSGLGAIAAAVAGWVFLRRRPGR